MSKIKYMGSADVRRLNAGENFGGRLATPLSESVVWNAENNWVVDTDEAGLSAEAVALLSKEVGFLDVSDLELVPVNDNQKIFRGMSDPEPVVVEKAAEPVSDAAVEAPTPLVQPTVKPDATATSAAKTK